jgi:hypothetical protein
MGGVVLDSRPLAIVTAAVWVVIFLQSGLLTDLAAGRSVCTSTAMPFASSIALWVALVWLLVVGSSAVPGWAALTASSSRGSASGTATVRLLKAKNQICWTIVASGLPAQTRAEFIDTGVHRTLVETPLRRGRSTACGDYGRASSENLALPFKRRHTPILLAVISPGGHRLLDGRIVPDLRDLKPTPGQSS